MQGLQFKNQELWNKTKAWTSSIAHHCRVVVKIKFCWRRLLRASIFLSIWPGKLLAVLKIEFGWRRIFIYLLISRQIWGIFFHCVETHWISVEILHIFLSLWPCKFWAVKIEFWFVWPLRMAIWVFKFSKGGIENSKNLHIPCK